MRTNIFWQTPGRRRATRPPKQGGKREASTMATANYFARGLECGTRIRGLQLQAEGVVNV
jgi:hypothetical protein